MLILLMLGTSIASAIIIGILGAVLDNKIIDAQEKGIKFKFFDWLFLYPILNALLKLVESTSQYPRIWLSIIKKTIIKMIVLLAILLLANLLITNNVISTVLTILFYMGVILLIISIIFYFSQKR